MKTPKKNFLGVLYFFIINKISKNDYVVNILLFLNCRERVKEKQLNPIEQQ